MSGNLHIVSTPIGNLGDITFRAVQILQSADIIACEDTRHTRKILNHYKIEGRLTSYHEHNENTKSQKLIKYLESGKNIALVTDAGTPCISDPGYKIVNLAIQKGINVTVIPGASSVISGLTISNLPTDSFSFFGFPPRSEKGKGNLIDDIRFIKSTLIFFESPKRIKTTLRYFLQGLGNRNAAICRELTKLHEEVMRGTLKDLCEALEKKQTIKGEICLVIEGFQESKEDKLSRNLTLINKRLNAFKDMNVSLSDAVRETAREFGLPKKEVYRKALEIWSD